MTLDRLGWDARWEAARAAADPDDAWQPVRIAAAHRGAYHALGPGGLAWVELTGRAFHDAGDRRALPVVGDWVLVESWAEALAETGAAVVRALLPRRSFLVRRAAGEATVPQPLVANVDTGIVLTSANADLSAARLDRYVSLLADGGIAPVLVLSKIDLVADPAPLVAQLAAIAPRVVTVSTVTGDGLDALRALGGPGTTCVLLGSSGVGKSTLLNAIAGTAQPTRAIRTDERGRHTTTRRELFITDAGLWIDTPGMRELGQWLDDEDDDTDDLAFDDIAALALQCRFRDCQHRDEPGCAVRDQIPAGRMASFHKLSTERRTGAARQGQAQKLAESRKARAKKPPPPADD
ncbi:MAG TPA: ribosome small subunit-dependent GTPase A [Kofleriaceae bacterium]|nr:ribosome small subunit-dependent GTPase A [Kofleriaceae bacterium]